MLGVAAGAAAALTLGGGMREGAVARATEPDAEDADVAIPRNRRALMAYSARTMLVNDKSKYPTLPSGLREVIDFAAAVGYTGIEFFSFTGGPSFSQTPNAEGGASPSAKQMRAWLDAAGMKAIGHYNASIANGGAVGLTPATIDAALESAAILGQPQTGSHDATNASRSEGRGGQGDRELERHGAEGVARRHPDYSHSHQIPWSFLLDTGPRDEKGYTRSSGIRVMDYFLKHTDAKWVKCEFDLFWAHVAQHQFHSYTAADGSTVEAAFDPAKQVAERSVALRDPAREGRHPRAEDARGIGDLSLRLRRSRTSRSSCVTRSSTARMPGGAASRTTPTAATRIRRRRCATSRTAIAVSRRSASPAGSVRRSTVRRRRAGADLRATWLFHHVPGPEQVRDHVGRRVAGARSREA